MNGNSEFNVDAALTSLDAQGKLGSDLVRAALVEKQARDLAAAKEAVIAVLAQASDNMERALRLLRDARKLEAAAKTQVVGLDTAHQAFLQHGDVNKYSLDVSTVIAAYNKSLRGN
jgi:hypothetical protein